MNRIPLWPLAAKGEQPVRRSYWSWLALALLILAALAGYLAYRSRPKPLWRYSILGTPLGNLTATSGLIFTASRENCLYALNAATGERLWRLVLPDSSVAPPEIAYGMIYLGSVTGQVAARQSTTGKEVWKREVLGGVTGLTAKRGLLLVATDHGLLTAFDSLTGERRWEIWPGGALGALAVGQDRLLIGDGNGRLYCVSLDSGAPLWQASLLGAVQCAPAVTQTHVAVGTAAGRAYLLEAERGQVLWSQPLPGPASHSPHIFGHWILFPADRTVVAYTMAGGAERWRCRLAGRITAPPVATEGRLLLGDETGRLYALSASGGSKTTLRARAQAPVAALVEYGDRFVVADWEGTVSCVLRARR